MTRGHGVGAGDRSDQRGATLLEVMMSLAVVLVGMLGLMRVLSVSVNGTSTGQRFIQAQARAQQILENIRAASRHPIEGRNIVLCLVARSADRWDTCESLCRTSLGPAADPTACAFTAKVMSQVGLGAALQDRDSTMTRYVTSADSGEQLYGSLTSWVQNDPVNQYLFTVQVAMGWNDDNSLTLPPKHVVTLRSSLYLTAP